MNTTMFNIGERIPFNTSTVADAPEVAALYELWVDDDLIYIGMSEGGKDSNLHTRLYRHLMGLEGPCTQKATHFMYDQNNNARDVENIMIDLYEGHFGKKPECNDVDPIAD